MIPYLALALLLSTSIPLCSADASSYQSNAICANDQLMRWYNSDQGLWLQPDNSAYWWQSANMLTVFNDLASRNADVKRIYAGVWDSTYRNAPGHKPEAFTSAPTSSSAVSSSSSSNSGSNSNTQPAASSSNGGARVKIYSSVSAPAGSSSSGGGQEGGEGGVSRVEAEQGFLNNFYDDEGWWGLAWVGALDNTGDSRYLDEAIAIWYDMHAAWNKFPCGGLPWNKEDDAPTVAIANELYIELSAALSNRVGPDQKPTYLNAARDAWTWFQRSGMINSQHLINDGIDSSCANNGAPTYSYNQGVILSGLVELYRATNDGSYLDAAAQIADAVTGEGSPLLDGEGILSDACDKSKGCSGDGVQFKGVFARGLARLQAVRGSDGWRSFLETNARSIWNRDLQVRDGACFVGVYWGGPYSEADASSQSSAMDCIVGALAVTS